METNGNSQTKIDPKNELAGFDDVFPEILEILAETSQLHPETNDAYVWFKKVSEYNVPHGKKNRGVSVISSYRHLVKDPSPENLKIARILGWGIEFLQAFFLITDDIMDHSITRRGQPCWYKVKDVGMIAINDALFLECVIYKLIRKFTKGKPYYTSVLELFLETTHQTVTGQCLDLITAPPEATVDFTQFTMERYSAIVKWKTAFYSFYLPVALAMYMAGINDEESHANAKKILLEMGHFFQVQDDYLDCFGAPEVIGKIGTDIEDNKCGWLIVTALEMASDAQKQIFRENYARNDQECVKKVKNVYRELDIEGVYKRYEEKSYQDLVSLIAKVSGDLPKQMFLDFANKIYKRQK